MMDPRPGGSQQDMRRKRAWESDMIPSAQTRVVLENET